MNGRGIAALMIGAVVLVGVLVNARDVARYIRISTM